jgi:hypothetical protein
MNSTIFKYRAIRHAAAVLALVAVSTQATAGFLGPDDKERLSPEAAQFIQDKPDPLKPFMRSLYMEGEWNAVLNLDMLAVASLDAGHPEFAEHALDMANERILRVYADDPNAEKAKSLWSAESVKDWKGEPFERAMSFYYRGLLYLNAGDYQNARASFLQADIQNSFGQYEKYDGNNFPLMRWLAAWSSHCDGDDATAKDLAGRASADASDPFFQGQPGRFPDYLVIYEVGRGPMKIATGAKKNVLAFQPQGDAADPVITYGATPVKPIVQAFAADIDTVAMTRGGRPIQGILDGKAVFQDNAQTVSDVAGAVSSGAMQALASNTSNLDLARNLGVLGAAGSFISLVAGTVSHATKTETDTRYWQTLPKKIYLQGYAQPLPGQIVQIGDKDHSRPVLLQGKHGICSFAWSHEVSALAQADGGMAQLSADPLPAESGRKEMNAELREQLKTAF